MTKVGIRNEKNLPRFFFPDLLNFFAYLPFLL